MMEQENPVPPGGADRPDVRYELFEELGSGTSGVVLRAHDRLLGRDVAIKLLHADRPPDALRRLQRESRLAASFHHRNAVEVYDSGELGGRPFIAMELMRGQSLAHALAADGPAPVEMIAPIATPLAEVLAAAHDAGLVHRDVKPSNIFLDGTLAAPGRVRLVDFGLAFMMTPTSGTVGRFTADGIIVGTPLYMAPEQASGDTVGPPADVYALGCLLYELATGRTPFVGSVPRILTGHLYLPPMGFAELELAREIPHGLEAIVMTMLEKDPARRPTAQAVIGLLRDVEAGAQRSASSGTRAERMVRAVGTDSRAPLVAAKIATADGELAASLAAGGVDVVAIADANVALVRLGDDGLVISPSMSGHTLPVFGVHASPTPRLIARAIQQGVIGVARWPGAAETLRARVAAALGHSQRLPVG